MPVIADVLYLSKCLYIDEKITEVCTYLEITVWFRHQAITWTNADHLGTNLGEILIEIQKLVKFNFSYHLQNIQMLWVAWVC